MSCRFFIDTMIIFFNLTLYKQNILENMICPLLKRTNKREFYWILQGTNKREFY
jgi:hypothetical protein